MSQETHEPQEPRLVRRRPNIARRSRAPFLKRYQGIGYWALLTIVLVMLIWFVAASASDRGESRDAEATVIATLFAPETATAEAEELLGGQ